MKLYLLIFLFTGLSGLLPAQVPVPDKEKLFDLYQTQRYAEAAAYLQQIYSDDTQDLKAIHQMAYCFMMAGKLPEAEKNYLKILEQQPAALPVWFNLAQINLKRGNTAKAREYLESIVKSDSMNFNALKQLASLYTNDTLSIRVDYLLKANRINPAEPDVAYELANAQRKLKKYDSAYAVLSIAIAADTGNLVLQQARLPIAIQLKRYKEVITTGEKLLTNGIDPNIVRDVAMACYYLKNYKQAIDYFKQLETIDAQSESSLYYTALCYRNLNDYKTAAEYAKRTIHEGISVNIPSYYLLLGGIYETRQEVSAAVNAYKKGLSFNANHTIYYRLGILYDLKLNQKKNAITWYQRYLKSRPDKVLDKEQIDYVKNRLEMLSAK